MDKEFLIIKEKNARPAPRKQEVRDDDNEVETNRIKGDIEIT